MRSPRSSSTLTVAILALAVLAPNTARADSAAAEVLFNEGKKLMAEGRYPEACAKLEESQRQDAGIGTLFNLADCHEHVGKFASAWGEFTEVAGLARAAGQPQREEAARQRAVALEPKLSKLVIRVGVAPSGLEVKRDEIVIGPAQFGTPIPVDPGEHKISVSAPKKRTWSTSIHAVAGTPPITVDVPVLENAPEPLPATDPEFGATGTVGGNDGSTQRTIGLVLAGFGVAGLVTGVIGGAFSMSHKSAANKTCNSNTNVCTDDYGVSQRDAALVTGDISTVGFVAGSLLALGGVVLYFSAPKKTDSRSARVGLGVFGSQVGVGGAF